MWGWDRYVSHEDLFNPKNKYLTDDALILEAHIQCMTSTKTLDETTTSTASNRALGGLAEDFLKIYTNSDFTDFTLVSRDGIRLRAHRAVLAARSDVFRSMISHDTKESVERVCEIEDTDGATLHALLKYMYGCTTLEGMEDVAERLLVAADKYGVKGLVNACEGHLIAQINAHNAARLLVLADMHSATQLKNAVHNFVSRNLGDFSNHGGMQVGFNWLIDWFIHRIVPSLDRSSDCLIDLAWSIDFTQCWLNDRLIDWLTGLISKVILITKTFFLSVQELSLYDSGALTELVTFVGANNASQNKGATPSKQAK